MSDIQIFNNPDFGDIRTVIIEGEPWFVGIDVAKALGYKKPTGAVTNNVDEDDTLTEGVTDSMGRLQNTLVVNESGLYSLIFNSKLESAKKFKKWVTSEVLPSIRKTGEYKQENAGDVQGQIKLLAQGTTELYQRVDEVTEDVKTVKEEIERLKDDLPLFPSEAEKISNAAKKKGVEVLGGKQSNAYRNKSLQHKVYSNIYANLKYNFDVTSYKAIKRGNRIEALRIVQNYQPPYFLAEQIRNENAQQNLDL